jgi:hypothetical protein
LFSNEHCKQAELPVAPKYFPTGHARQAVEPGELALVPAGHAEHDDIPAPNA